MMEAVSAQILYLTVVMPAFQGALSAVVTMELPPEVHLVTLGATVWCQAVTGLPLAIVQSAQEVPIQIMLIPELIIL